MQLDSKKILVSGGAGFIGSTLVKRLLKDYPKCEITILDSFSRDALSRSGLGDEPRLTILKGDIRDESLARQAVADAEVIVHAAGIAGIDTVSQAPTLTMEVNLLGTAFLLKLAQQAGKCERFINFSTSEVFGSYAYKATETDFTSAGAVGEARWVYAVSKLAGEHLAFAYYKEFDLPTVTVRPFNVYGPAQIGEGAIHVFVTQALANEPLKIHGDGDQVRAWTYIDDMIDGVLATLTSDAAVGQSFNIGNPRGAVTVRSLAETVRRLVGTKIAIEHVQKPYVDIDLRIPNIDKAREILGFEPKVDLEEGLAATIDYYRKT